MSIQRVATISSAVESFAGVTWGAATSIGTKTGTFTTVFEETAGNFTYWVAAIDSAGNYGSPAQVAVTVGRPPDYVLYQNWTSTFSGTVVNAVVTNNTLTVPINLTETVAEHFDDRSWANPQDQIDAGYPLYIQPTNLTGSYTETFDYGAIIPSTKVTVDVTTFNRAGVVTMTPTVSLSTDGLNWTDYPNTLQVFSAGFRYVKVLLEFSSSDNTGIMDVTQIVVRLDVKQRNDNGKGTTVASDVNGTWVDFNVDFLDVETVTVTPQGTTPITAVYDFDDVVSPTGFSVYTFDNSGNRVSAPFSWSAKGV